MEIDIVTSIFTKIAANAELVTCPDCEYCFHIAISKNREIPIIPYYSKENNERKLWIQKYGADYNQMYLSVSRLGKYAMMYWSKYGRFIFMETRKLNYKPPDSHWEIVWKNIMAILESYQIKVVPPPLLYKIYRVKYKGKTIGYDKTPTLVKLLFTEELH